jgi:hypothetical protein
VRGGSAVLDMRADRFCVRDAVMDAVSSAALGEGTFGWLKRVESLLDEADTPSRAALAEVEMPRLIATLRALLAEHEPDEDGQCHRCSGGRRRRTGLHCSLWVTVHRYLVVNDTTGYDGGPHATSAARRSAW